MKTLPLSAYQMAALKRLADEGEITGPMTTTLLSLVKRDLIIKKEIKGSEEFRFALTSRQPAVIQTVGDLIAELSKLDPKIRIGLHDGGGLVRPVTEILKDTLHVASQDRTFATLGRNIDKPGFKGLRLEEAGKIVILD